LSSFEPELPLDIPLSHAPRQRRAPIGRVVPHAILACAQTRLVALGAMFCGAFLIVTLRLVDATLLSSTSAATELAGPVSAQAIQAARADITDRNGEVLATSLPTESLYADPAKLLDPVVAARALVEALPDLDYEDVLDKLASARRFVWIKRNLTPDEVYRVNALGQPGLEFLTEQTRVYPAGGSVVHVVGTTDVDNKGQGGIERGLNAQLSTSTAPVKLSLDIRLQHLVEREIAKAIADFDAIGGAGMVMDLQTGELLAAVSLPDYQPGAIGKASDEARFNRFALGSYELGSVMKVITAAAGLESGKMSLNSFFDASEPIRFGRHTINDFKPERRPLSVAEVFTHSSNIGAAKMALAMGTEFEREFFCKVGLCSPLKVQIPEVGPTQWPSKWSDITAMTAAFGHGFSVTPLHMMRATAAVLTGRLVEPTFLKQPDTLGAQGEPVVSDKVVEQIRRLMRANSVVGSGRSANVPGYFVGGKTGTAEKISGKRYSKNARLSSFIAAFPMHDPRYLIMVMVDEPKPNATSGGYATGGTVSAPTVGRIIAQMGPLYAMAPAAVDDPGIRRSLMLEIRSQKDDVETY
jgi:cell division protein FtsI (penicillin-binding protein 3)